MKRIEYLPDDAVILTLQTARKERRCNAEPSPSGCTGRFGSVIKPGEVYAKAAITPRHDAGDGHWWRQSFCIRCAEWWGWLDALTVEERQAVSA